MDEDGSTTSPPKSVSIMSTLNATNPNLDRAATYAVTAHLAGDGEPRTETEPENQQA
jgi:hypothetical protein